MLSHLLIKNYALIEQLELTPDDELNIITGETGAGKSIMLGGYLAYCSAIGLIHGYCTIRLRNVLLKVHLGFPAILLNRFSKKKNSITAQPAWSVGRLVRVGNRALL